MFLYRIKYNKFVLFIKWKILDLQCLKKLISSICHKLNSMTFLTFWLDKKYEEIKK